MTTGNMTLDVLLALILLAATIWYVKSLVVELYRLLRKKTYRLSIYHDDEQTHEFICTYRERSMRSAMVNHFLSYNCDLAKLRYQPYIEYNDLVMCYTLNIEGETYYFTMFQEVEGVKVEQR